MVAIIAIVLIMALSSSDSDKIVGKWSYIDDRYSFTFYNDGTGVLKKREIIQYHINYKISGNELTIEPLNSDKPTRTVTFSISGNKMIWTEENGKTEELNRIGEN